MPRTYSSPLRDRQAEATRARILATAGELFAEHGYAQTSVRQIAATAGVSLDRIYNLGGKAAIFLQALEAAMADDAEGVSLLDSTDARRALAGTTLGDVIAGLATVIVRSHRRSAGMWRALQGGATIDEELSEALAVREAAMRGQVRVVIDGLVERGLIAAPADGERTADLCWAALHPAQWSLLVGSLGWTPDRFEAWLAQRVRALLTEAAPA